MNEFSELIDESINRVANALLKYETCGLCELMWEGFNNTDDSLSDAWDDFSYKYLKPDALRDVYYFGAVREIHQKSFPKDFNDYKENQKHRLLALEMFRMYLKGEL